MSQSLFSAAGFGDAALIQSLLDAGADHAALDELGETALMHAAHAGHLEAVQTLLARKLGQNGYGRYVYVLAWMNVAMVVAKLEFDTLALRFIASYAGTHRWRWLCKCLRQDRSRLCRSARAPCSIPWRMERDLRWRLPRHHQWPR